MPTFKKPGGPGRHPGRFLRFRSQKAYANAAQVSAFVYVATGGITFGGIAATSKDKAYTATGGLTTGGTATVSKGKVFTASGGLVTGGAATVSKGKVYTATGGIVFAGTATTAKGKVYSATGGITFGGAASTATVHQWVYTPTGGLVTGGAASLAKGKAFTATGGASFGGSAELSKGKVFPPSGGLTSGGVAGTLYSSGVIPEVQQPITFLSGVRSWFRSKTATTSSVQHIGTGGIRFGGTASTGFHRGLLVPVVRRSEWVYTGTGGMAFGGRAPVAIGRAYRASGGAQFGGAAILQFRPAPPKDFVVASNVVEFTVAEPNRSARTFRVKT